MLKRFAWMTVGVWVSATVSALVQEGATVGLVALVITAIIGTMARWLTPKKEGKRYV